MSFHYSSTPVDRLVSMLNNDRQIVTELRTSVIAWRRRAETMPTPLIRHTARMQQRWVVEKLTEFETRITQTIVALVRRTSDRAELAVACVPGDTH